MRNISKVKLNVKSHMQECCCCDRIQYEKLCDACIGIQGKTNTALHLYNSSLNKKLKFSNYNLEVIFAPSKKLGPNKTNAEFTAMHHTRMLFLSESVFVNKSVEWMTQWLPRSIKIVVLFLNELVFLNKSVVYKWKNKLIH